MSKSMKRIHSVTIKRMYDQDPDPSYLEQDGFEDRLDQYRRDVFTFGNFSRTAYRYKGKRYFGLPKAHDGSELRDDTATGDAALPHIFHKE